MLNSKKGFTLIELLIVITIIGILAVAFLPTILGAPAKGRDTQRIADLQKIQTVLVAKNLTGTAYPATGCVAATFTGTWLPEFGGTAPKAPAHPNTDLTVAGTTCSNSDYVYILAPTSGTTKYSFGLYTRVENYAQANATCTTGATALANNATSLVKPAATAAQSEYCYGILVQ